MTKELLNEFMNALIDRTLFRHLLLLLDDDRNSGMALVPRNR